MRLRTRLGRAMDETIGKRHTDRVRRLERQTRQHVADWIAPRPLRSVRAPAPAASERSGRQQAPRSTSERRPLGEPNDRQGGWIPSDPFVSHPQPTMTRHDLLRSLHQVLSPRTYIEIGVDEGASLALSNAKSIGIDPEFIVRRALHCDLHLVRAKSDEFFGRSDGLAHFNGVPIDLAFIDGMHLSEFALRDFMNVERHLSRAGVVVFDDVLPRNALEAARLRRTSAWAGDVYKAVEVIARYRADLAVLLVNTRSTGTAIIVGADPSSQILQHAYSSELSYLRAPDPQAPPAEFMSRTIAVDPSALLASEAWPLLVAARNSQNIGLIEKAKRILEAIPKLK
jgi:predicted O-methyltransferase YrrM